MSELDDFLSDAPITDDELRSARARRFGRDAVEETTAAEPSAAPVVPEVDDDWLHDDAPAIAQPLNAAAFALDEGDADDELPLAAEAMGESPDAAAPDTASEMPGPYDAMLAYDDTEVFEGWADDAQDFDEDPDAPAAPTLDHVMAGEHDAQASEPEGAPEPPEAVDDESHPADENALPGDEDAGAERPVELHVAGEHLGDGDAFAVADEAVEIEDDTPAPELTREVPAFDEAFPLNAPTPDVASSGGDEPSPATADDGSCLSEPDRVSSPPSKPSPLRVPTSPPIMPRSVVEAEHGSARVVSIAPPLRISPAVTRDEVQTSSRAADEDESEGKREVAVLVAVSLLLLLLIPSILYFEYRDPAKPPADAITQVVNEPSVRSRTPHKRVKRRKPKRKSPAPVAAPPQAVVAPAPVPVGAPSSSAAVGTGDLAPAGTP